MPFLSIRSTVAGALLAVGAGVFSAQPSHAAAFPAGGSSPAAAPMSAQEHWGPYRYYDVDFPTRVAAVQGLTALWMSLKDTAGIGWPIETEVFSASEWIGEAFRTVWRIRWRDGVPD